jgi:phenylpropionate dioxygenase-like ring-hydroxylating dioxygenase large terminal subunit
VTDTSSTGTSTDALAGKRRSVVDEWFPVAAGAAVGPGVALPFSLLDQRCLLLCDGDGRVTAVADTCPHRGAQLSLGQFDGHELVCPYHGWRFQPHGRCRLQPAHPDREPPAAADLTTYSVQWAYDLWWVSLGSVPRNLPRYPAFDRFPGQSTLCEARTVMASGPRLIENFLDLAHLPFVHDGSLGVPDHAEVMDYRIAVGGNEITATDCHVWQPQAGPATGDGIWVTYSFAVSHPYAARLRKTPRLADGETGGDTDSASFDILLAVSPEHETQCRVWMLTTAHSPDADLDDYKRFGAFIFDQDVPIVESQRPALLPLEPKAELHQRADRMSLAYRRWLRDRGVTYGTTSGVSGAPASAR